MNMKVNIVDSSYLFKKSITHESINPKTYTEVIEGFKEIQKIVGKKIIITLRNLRWSINELEFFVDKGVLNQEFDKIIGGKATMIELSDL